MNYTFFAKKKKIFALESASFKTKKNLLPVKNSLNETIFSFVVRKTAEGIYVDRIPAPDWTFRFPTSSRNTQSPFFHWRRKCNDLGGKVFQFIFSFRGGQHSKRLCPCRVFAFVSRLGSSNTSFSPLCRDSFRLFLLTEIRSGRKEGLCPLRSPFTSIWMTIQVLGGYGTFSTNDNAGFFFAPFCLFRFIVFCSAPSSLVRDVLLIVRACI